MEYNIDIFRENIEKILDEADESELYDFTCDLFDCIYSDLVCEDESELYKNTVEAYADEIKNSIDIFNPSIKMDLLFLEKMLLELDRYLEMT